MNGDVRPERFSKRLMHYSTWHRECAGTPTYVTDIDWLEYRHGREGVALIEVKMYPGTIDWPQRTALNDLASRADLPFFVVTYWFPPGQDEAYATYRFKVKPLNEKALQLQPECAMDSTAYAEFLSRL